MGKEEKEFEPTVKEFVPGDKKLSPVLKTWRGWFGSSKVKTIQRGGIYAGKSYPSLYEIKGKIYRDANVTAPTYRFEVAPALITDLRPELVEYFGLEKKVPEKSIKEEKRYTKAKAGFDEVWEDSVKGTYDDFVEGIVAITGLTKRAIIDSLPAKIFKNIRKDPGAYKDIALAKIEAAHKAGK